MRIDSYNKLQQTGPIAQVGGQSRTGQRTVGGAPTGETVTFSAAAQELADRAAAEADGAKVAALTASIKDGTFKVDAHAIARRIVEGG